VIFSTFYLFVPADNNLEHVFWQKAKRVPADNNLERVFWQKAKRVPADNNLERVFGKKLQARSGG